MAEIPKSFSPQQAQFEIGWPRNLLIFSVVLVLFAGALAMGLGAYRSVLVEQNAAIEKEINDIVLFLKPEEVKKLLTLDTQIKNLQYLLPAHVYLSRLFDLLEKHTIPQVRLVQVSARHGARDATIQGIATSTEYVFQQAAAYGALQDLEAFSIKNAVFGAEGYYFNFALTYKPHLAQFKSP